MRLSQKYAPTTLDEIVGQPAVVRRLKLFAQEPYPRCVMLEGTGGIGKSATAAALIADLGVSEHGGLVKRAAASMKIEEVRWLFGHHIEGRAPTSGFRMIPMFGAPWHVLLIEEMERLPSDNVPSMLKDELSEQNHPPRLIVIATSNSTAILDKALLQRFDVFPFGSGPSFANDCLDRLHAIWAIETGDDSPLPPEVFSAGWEGDSYSMRRALAAMEGTLELHETRREEVAA